MNVCLVGHMNETRAQECWRNERELGMEQAVSATEGKQHARRKEENAIKRALKLCWKCMGKVIDSGLDGMV
ncbi:unnamed protein product [Calypogeia fissa]